MTLASLIFFNLNKHTLFWVVKELSLDHELFGQNKYLTLNVPCRIQRLLLTDMVCQKFLKHFHVQMNHGKCQCLSTTVTHTLYIFIHSLFKYNSDHAEVTRRGIKEMVSTLYGGCGVCLFVLNMCALVLKYPKGLI